MNYEINYLSLFSGIGGFELGLQQAGFKFKWHGFSEIDKYAKQIYQKHFPDAEDLGDVKSIQAKTESIWKNDKEAIRIGEERSEDVRNKGLEGDRTKPCKLSHGDSDRQSNNRGESKEVRTTTITTASGTFQINGHINLITFGFPCQDLSIAGKRGGLEASRSSLFFEAMRIIRDAKPDYFIFENVKGLFSSNGGFDWLVVLREVADAGYDGQWQLLNTRWVLPQNRERIYFVGHIRGRSRPKVFPVGESNEIFRESRKEGKIENQLSTAITQNLKRGVHSGGETLIQIGTLGKDSEATRVYSPDGCARTIKDGGGEAAKTGLYEMGLMHERRIRRLTPIECERLQGFPDGWTDGISDTQRYKTLGNAVSVPVVKAVAEGLLKG